MASTKIDPLDLLITSIVAEDGEPSPEAQAWAEDAMAKARQARLRRAAELSDEDA